MVFLPVKKSDKIGKSDNGHPTFIKLLKIRFHSSNQDPCVQLHTSYLCPVIAKLQTDADDKSKDLHEKTASSPGQRRAGGDDKSGLVVNTESGVSGVAWTKRMNGAQACLQTNSHQLRRYRRLCRSGRFHMPPSVP